MLGNNLFPIDKRWDILCTASSSAMNSLSKLNEVIHNRFGDAKDIDEYLYRADMLNYESTKAMFESFRARVPHTTGIIQWMLNGARPGIYWQLYDYYKQPNAAYYGVKKGNAPVQLIYDYHQKAVYAVNETLEPVAFKSSMQLIKNAGNEKKEQEVKVEPATSVKVFDIDMGDDPAAFLFLQCLDADGKTFESNEYFLITGEDTYNWSATTWVHTPITQYASYKMLDEMTVRTCELSVEKKQADSYEVTVTNPSDKVAFMIRLTAKDSKGNLVCPAYWSDNYLTLAPGESRNITCRMPSLPKDAKVTIQAE